MLDQIIRERLELIIEHANVILKRMLDVDDANWFTSTEGEILYDSLIIRLQAIGENIKKIERIQHGFSKDNLFINSGVIRLSDLISHHYELLDYQVIFNICKNDIPILKEKISNFLTRQD